MSITLSRTIQARCFDVEGTVAFAEDRPEYLALVQLAQDLRRPINGADVSRELLQGLPASMGWRALERCVALGLFEFDLVQRKATPSQDGLRALEEEAVPVPQEGIFRIWYVEEEPLLQSPILHLRPISEDEASGRTKKERGGKGKERRGPGPGRTPALLKGLRPELIPLPVEGKLVRIDDLAAHGEGSDRADLTLTLTWPEDEPPWVEAEIALPESERSRPTSWRPPPSERLGQISYTQLWANLLSAHLGVELSTVAAWIRRYGIGVIERSFEGLAEAQRRSFEEVLRVSSPALERLGRFDTCAFPTVRLQPTDAREATRWLRWLQRDGLQTYEIPRTLEARSLELQRRFSHHAPTPLGPEELRAEAESAHPSATSWHLLAPHDLGLWPHAGA